MTYINTNHQFVIDDKHPTDVFDEMANFFSLYTVALDNLNRMSLQLNVPADFDIDGNQKLHDSYQQFTKAVKYSIPDINVLPIQQAESDNQNDKVTLMIQTFEGRVADEVNAENTEHKPKFYQKLLGGLLPKFASEATQEGLYPEQVAPVMAIPAPAPTAIVAPQPVAISQPIPQPTPIQQPQPTSQATPQVRPQPIPQPVTVQPIVTPQPQSPQIQPQSPVQQPRSIPTPIQPPASAPINQTTPKILLPKPSKSIRPYREILTQAILSQAQTQSANYQLITAITFKSRDSLTTAFIETVFASFSAQNSMGRAGDAIDLASFGLEELRPKLANIGVNLADDAQFLLNSKAKARPEDIALIQQGQLEPSAVNVGVQINYASATDNSPINSQPRSQPTVQPTSQTLPHNTNTLNTNRFNIAINVKVSDSMGERTVKLREFPAVFSTQNSHPNSAKLIKVMTHQAQGELFYLAEQDGQLLAQRVTQGIVLHRNGQASQLQENMSLLPNDVLQMGDVQIGLLLN